MFKICRFCMNVLRLVLALHLSITGTSSSAVSNVAAYLISQCTDEPFTLNPLPAGTHYVGPTSPQDANECECSSVVYSLVSACAACQERNYEGWDVWRTNCSNIYYSVFPKNIPILTTVPVWAYVDYTDIDTFNPQDAQSKASEKLPDSSFIPESTSTTSSFTAPPSPATTITTSSSSTITTRTPMTTAPDHPSPTPSKNANENDFKSAGRSRTISIFIWIVVGLVSILGFSILSVYLTKRWREYRENRLLNQRYHAVHSRENSQPEEMKELVRATAESSRISIPSMIPYPPSDAGSVLQLSPAVESSAFYNSLEEGDRPTRDFGPPGGAQWHYTPQRYLA
ncbi:hypothetical protein IW261DRAFT_976498 [Armillaria novae-zelandiae]|uniref:Uncharacterized protein n=1 Tax=Armillaria novae-zelandiae TaxID=153914 RepID=A0AA39PHK2_9AGAR|nr:hypothetical protein IW261DRAFT_976498 [Armillaria novae-zelandiae]